MIDSYENFKKEVLRITGIDLDSYKENQMKRRIDSLISRNKVSDYHSYIDIIKYDKDKYEEFVSYLTINVSEFWRNADQWKVLETKILPLLMCSEGIKIWSAACSTGDEPYSVVMLLSDYYPMSKIRIYATDIDKQILAKAKSGVYSASSLKGLPDKYRRKFFSQLADGAYEICEEVKRCVTFKEHDLLKSPYPTGYDLIICRNVLIYFTDDAKNKIFRKFNESLRKDGILFLGSTEQILYPKEFGFVPISSFFYKKL